MATNNGLTMRVLRQRVLEFLDPRWCQVIIAILAETHAWRGRHRKVIQASSRLLADFVRSQYGDLDKCTPHRSFSSRSTRRSKMEPDGLDERSEYEGRLDESSEHAGNEIGTCKIILPGHHPT